MKSSISRSFVHLFCTKLASPKQVLSLPGPWRTYSENCKPATKTSVGARAPSGGHDSESLSLTAVFLMGLSGPLPWTQRLLQN